MSQYMLRGWSTEVLTRLCSTLEPLLKEVWKDGVGVVARFEGGWCVAEGNDGVHVEGRRVIAHHDVELCGQAARDL